jgi:hypothetical protein
MLYLTRYTLMKLPSISHAVAEARDTFMRFPFVILDAIIGTICALVLIDTEPISAPTVLVPIFHSAVLAFPFLAGLALTAENWKVERALSIGTQLAGVVLVGLYALTVPRELDGVPNIYTLRLVLLTLGMFLFACTFPYLRHKNELGYWNFCKALGLRVFTAGLFAVVLWGGLAIALAALDNLFGVKIRGVRYAELWVCIIGIFSTWFVLAGVPKDADELDEMTEYPKGLKILSQYILFPLVCIYLVILYSYLGKILITWNWPQGWVSRLILGFIATGFVSLLLMHPIRNKIENRWVNTASRWFYVVILPLTLMLFLAVWERVSMYGITEGRYVGLATVAWLCIVTPYFIISSKKKIIVLAASLCVEVFLVSFGPWGMFAVSERSQVARLRELLEQHHLLVDGRVQSTHDTLPIETTRQISSIVGYLSEMHGYDAIQPWFGESLRSDSAGHAYSFKDPAAIAKLMGVTYIRTWQAGADNTVIMTADRERALDIKGYEWLLRGQNSYSGGTTHEFPEQGVVVRIGKDARTMTFTFVREQKFADSLTIDVMPVAEKLVAEYGNASTGKIPPELMTITVAGKTEMVRVFLATLRLQRHTEMPEVQSFEAEIAYTHQGR